PSGCPPGWDGREAGAAGARGWGRGSRLGHGGGRAMGQVRPHGFQLAVGQTTASNLCEMSNKGKSRRRTGDDRPGTWRHGPAGVDDAVRDCLADRDRQEGTRTDQLKAANGAGSRCPSKSNMAWFSQAFPDAGSSGSHPAPSTAGHAGPPYTAPRRRPRVDGADPVTSWTARNAAAWPSGDAGYPSASCDGSATMFSNGESGSSSRVKA